MGLRDEILEKISRIKSVDGDCIAGAKAIQDSLAKPPESLGKLEDISIRLAGIVSAETGNSSVDPDPESGKCKSSSASDRTHMKEADLSRGCVRVFCADNGVAAQGVASAPQSVTRAQTINFTRRLTGVGALAESYGSDLLIVDMGVKDPIPEELYDDVPLKDTHKIVDRRIRPGTNDISEGPAMTEEEALRAIKTGMEMAEAASDEGFGIIGIGEMGIGNTTTSAAILSSLTGESAEVTCGRGGGVNDEGFRRKSNIIDSCSLRYREDGGLLKRFPIFEYGNGNRLDRVVEMLADCGGFDICAMTGAYLGAAACRMPVVIDGYISVVAALSAATICPAAVDYMFASHRSAEPGYSLAVEHLGLDPFLSLDMRLGEGSGCPIAFSIIRGAWDVMMNMATFEEAKIDDDYLEEIRQEEHFRG